MKKTISLITALVLSVLCAVSLVGCEKPIPASDAVSVTAPMKYIIHGAGVMHGYDTYDQPFDFTCSNSAEGLAQCAEAGAPVIELDFSFTSDGRLVCIHDWYHMYAEEIENDVALTHDEFKNVKIYRQYTPLDIEDVVEYMREHDYVYIVTDIKDDNIAGLTAIAELCPELRDRFIAQIYSADEYDKVRELGFDSIIYTLYRLTWNEKTDTAALAEFAKSHPLVGYTFAAELCDKEGYVDGMKKAGVPLFIHTIDGAEEQQKYFDMGIDGIYTNDVVK